MVRAVAATFEAAVVLLAASAGDAAAGGGTYSFVGGTADERAQVRQALNASSFDWNTVPARITITIAPGIASKASPGQIWLDSRLIDMGTFAWASIQHEYAHQVDFLLFHDRIRAALLVLLGGKEWCANGGPIIDHASYGCERFASTLAWTYWQSPDNSLRPRSPSDESAAMQPALFKGLLGLVQRQRDRVTPGAFDALLLGRVPRPR